MSSDESDEDIPPADECQQRCEDFATITGTDTACAQFYLQDRKWNLEQSINDFFEDRSNKGALRVNDKDESEVVVVVDGSSQSLAAAATAVFAESALSRNSHPKGHKRLKTEDEQESTDKPKTENLPTEPKSEEYKEIKFITWNIDGLNEKNLKLRTKAVYKRILNEQADVVFLQEVVPESAGYFIKHLLDYECLFGNEVGYFVGTLLKKSTVKCEDSNIIPFPDTRMMRNILKVNAQVGDVSVCLINGHLESTSEAEGERKQQLRMSLNKMLAVPQNRSVIFAGDMNLRDKELNAMGGLPVGIEDIWEKLGKRKECAYTWDMTRNDNLLYNSKFKPRCRFDRVFFRNSTPAKLVPKFFGLVGLERLLPHRCFPSDHWGILCHFAIK